MLSRGLLVFTQGILIGVSLCVSYLFLLAMASLKSPGISLSSESKHRFAIAVPAHNEEAVMGNTIAGLQTLDYLSGLDDIHVVSDNSTDYIARMVREHGVIYWEHFGEEHKGKGCAVAWLFERLLVCE